MQLYGNFKAGIPYLILRTIEVMLMQTINRVNDVLLWQVTNDNKTKCLYTPAYRC